MNAIRRRLADDSGTTLIELVVGMVVMTVFMGIFTGAMLMMSRTVNNVEAVSSSTSQLNSAFLTLDREVRYATGISTPAYSTALPGWNVEFSSTQIDRSTSPSTPVNTCTQLRIYQSQLWQRTWTVRTNSSGTVVAVTGSGTAWKPLAGGLPAAATAQNLTPTSTPAQPFVLAVAAGSGLQQLTVNLTTTSTGAGTASSSSSTTYTALNTNTATGSIDPTTVCQQVAPEAAAP